MSSVPDLYQLRAWTRVRVTERRRSSLTKTDGFSDIYVLMLGVGVWAPMLFHFFARSDVRLSPVYVDTFTGITRFSPMWFGTGTALLGAAACVGALRRLGPLFLRVEETIWWLSCPGDRGHLMRLLARRIVAGGALVGAVAAAALVWLLGGDAFGVAGAAGSAASMIACGLVLTVRSQVINRGAGVLRLFFLMVATIAICISGIFVDSSPYRMWIVGCSVLATVAGTYAAWLVTAPSLGSVPDVILSESAQRGASLRAVGLALDTRGLGFVLAPPVRRPLRPDSLAVVRWALLGEGLFRWIFTGSRSRSVLGVVQADLLLLRRQPWRTVTALCLAVIAGLLLLFDAYGFGLAMLLVFAWLVSLICADAARRAQRDDAPDSLWPAAPVWVRLGHFIIPALFMIFWWCAVDLVVVFGSAIMNDDVPGELLVAGFLSGPGWAGVSLRSGFRRDSDWSMSVPTPVGLIPIGLLQSVTVGPDAAVVLVIPVLIADTLSVSMSLCLAQLGLSFLVVILGFLTGRDNMR
ncbi:hypothetical protein [Actinomyces wuliandei]|uniref:hypothetical protein n=1 Tax=Actinomyces wuliandei TaxID=2057743 RepID=UPI000FDA6699|nr:hypothetical protein [Actinomyces wuliandei]